MRIVFIVGVLICIGCSSRGAYEQTRRWHVQDCAELQGRAYEECMEGANLSYEDYQRLRDSPPE